MAACTSRIRAALALGAALLAGCAGQQGVATRFYLLSPLPADTPALVTPGPAPVAVDVGALRVPQYLQRPQIVTRASDNRVTLAEYEQWGGNLEKNMTRVLARNLSRLLDTPEITVFSRRPPGTRSVRVEMDVLEFERGADGRVRLAAQWRLRDGDGSPLVARVTELESAAIPDGSPMEATVGAMSGLWGELSMLVARAIVEAGASRS